MRRTKFWQAFTNEGIKYIAKQKFNKVQYEIILYFSAVMSNDNMITTPKKSELRKSINHELELDPPIQAPNFYKNFSKLEESYIIRKTDQPGFTDGYMMNPFITYKSGLRNYEVFINWLNLINAKPRELKKGEFYWRPEQGFIVNGKIMKPYEPQIFHPNMEIEELYGYKYQDYFEDKYEKTCESKDWFTKEDIDKAF